MHDVQDLERGGRPLDVAALPRVEYALVDVDGTIVGADGGISDAVVAALREGLEDGLRIGIATGRGTGGIEPVTALVDLPGPHVVSNGAAVLDADGAVLWSKPLTEEMRTAILQHTQERDWYVEWYTPEGMWISDERDAGMEHIELLGVTPLGVLDGDLSVIDDAIKALTIVKVDERPDDVAEELAGLGVEVGPGISPALPHLWFANLTAPDVHKGRGLEEACRTLGLDVAATAAIGDEQNDVPMLRIAGLSLAMGQAPEEVRAAGHLVLPPVGEDGLVRGLELVRGTRAGD